MIKKHEIKLQLPYCDAVLYGDKNFEVRENDRGYQKGDLVQFKPIDGMIRFHHSVEDKLYRITYVHSGLGLEQGYVVFGIREEEEQK